MYIRHLSGSGYEALRNTGTVHLPSQRTLRDYTYYTSASIGFSSSIDRQVMEAGRISDCPEREKYVAIIMDEMTIREDLVYNKHTGMNVLCIMF